LKSRNKNLSNNFKCYAWIIDKENKEIYLLLATDKGEIILLDNNCEFKKVCEGSPLNYSIESMEI